MKRMFKIAGPECPNCGCCDCETIDERRRLTVRYTRYVCDCCGKQFRVSHPLEENGKSNTDGTPPV
jgi:hypothetical protein